VYLPAYSALLDGMLYPSYLVAGCHNDPLSFLPQATDEHPGLS
jgi:hypothetical protein